MTFIFGGNNNEGKVNYTKNILLAIRELCDVVPGVI